MEAGGVDGRTWMMVRGGTGPEERTGAGNGWRDEEEKLEREGEGGDQVGGVSWGGVEKKRDTRSEAQALVTGATLGGRSSAGRAARTLAAQTSGHAISAQDPTALCALSAKMEYLIFCFWLLQRQANWLEHETG